MAQQERDQRNLHAILADHGPAEELDAGWRETAYLLASPANAAILRMAADRRSDVKMSIDDLWAHFGVPKE